MSEENVGQVDGLAAVKQADLRGKEGAKKLWHSHQRNTAIGGAPWSQCRQIIFNKKRPEFRGRRQAICM